MCFRAVAANGPPRSIKVRSNSLASEKARRSASILSWAESAAQNLAAVSSPWLRHVWRLLSCFCRRGPLERDTPVAAPHFREARTRRFRTKKPAFLQFTDSGEKFSFEIGRVVVAGQANVLTAKFPQIEFAAF